jgi:hypothetical protein
MSLNTDLRGLFNIQKDYLAGLALNSTDPDLNNKVTLLQTNLDKLNTDFQQSNVSSSAVLARQQEVSSIINEEKSRLEEKKQSIDNALVGKKRAIELNDSYRMVQSQYIRIKIVIVLVLVICIVLTLLNRQFPIVPSIIVTLINMIVVIIGSIYCLFIYAAISSRSPMNYNELDLAGPAAPTASEIAASQVAAGKAGNLLGTVNLLGCAGAACCFTGTKWDNEKSKCVPDTVTTPPVSPVTPNILPGTPPVSGFATMEPSGPIAHAPSEYDSYGRV